MKKIIKDWFTGIDGVSYDIGKFLWFSSVIVFLCCAVYALYKGQTWDAVAFGTGLGLVLAAGGAAIAVKAGTEPKER